MCTGLEIAAIASLASTVGGTIMRNNAAQKQQEARNAALAAERERQANFARQADQRVAQTESQFTQPAQEKQQDATAAKLSTDYQAGAVTPNATVIGGQATAPREVQDAISARVGVAETRQKSLADALAKLSSYSAQAGKNNIALGRSAQDIDQITSNMRGSSGVLPLELQAANMKGQGDMQMADVLNGIGSISGLYASMGGGFGDLAKKFNPAPVSTATPKPTGRFI